MLGREFISVDVKNKKIRLFRQINMFFIFENNKTKTIFHNLNKLRCRICKIFLHYIYNPH